VDREEVVSRLQSNGSRLGSTYGVSFMILFGSLARSDLPQESLSMSDIDIAVQLSEDARGIEQPSAGMGKNVGRANDGSLLPLLGELIDILGTDSIDIVLLNEAPPALKYEVFTTGKLIYSRSEEEYENEYLKANIEYLDFKPFLIDWFKEALRRISAT